MKLFFAKNEVPGILQIIHANIQLSTHKAFKFGKQRMKGID